MSAVLFSFPILECIVGWRGDANDPDELLVRPAIVLARKETPLGPLYEVRVFLGSKSDAVNFQGPTIEEANIGTCFRHGVVEIDAPENYVAGTVAVLPAGWNDRALPPVE